MKTAACADHVWPLPGKLRRTTDPDCPGRLRDRAFCSARPFCPETMMTDNTPRGPIASRRTLLRAGVGAAAASALGMPAVHAAERVVKISLQRSSVLLTVLKVKGILGERLGPLGFTPSWHLFTSV